MPPMDRPEHPPLEFPEVAPVALEAEAPDAVSHSLAVLSTVYHYNHWIFLTFREHLGPAVLEIGAGVGNITQFLLNLDRVVCLEPFGPYRRYLSERFARHSNVAVSPRRIEDCPNADVPAGAFDTVLCVNVLEHLADDVDSLRRMKALLKPGGRAVVFVPALPCIFGAMDRAMGHLRRYTLRSLRRAIVRAGMRCERGRYMNLIGAAAWWWHGRVRGKSHIPASATRKFDHLVPVLSAVERLIPPVVGQSVYVVARA